MRRRDGAPAACWTSVPRRASPRALASPYESAQETAGGLRGDTPALLHCLLPERPRELFVHEIRRSRRTCLPALERGRYSAVGCPETLRTGPAHGCRFLPPQQMGEQEEIMVGVNANLASAVDGGIPLQPNTGRPCPAATDPRC
jgi:hypothetical protein